MSFLGLFLFLSLGSSMVTACSPVGTPLLNSSHLDQILSSVFFCTWRLKMLLGPRKPRPTPAGNQMCISLSAQVKSASKPEACSLSPVCSLYLTFLTQTQYPTLRCSLGEWHSTNGEEGAEGRGGAQTGRRTLPLPDHLEVTGSRQWARLKSLVGSGVEGVMFWGIFQKNI